MGLCNTAVGLGILERTWGLEPSHKDGELGVLSKNPRFTSRLCFQTTGFGYTALSLVFLGKGGRNFGLGYLIGGGRQTNTESGASQKTKTKCRLLSKSTPKQTKHLNMLGFPPRKKKDRHTKNTNQNTHAHTHTHTHTSTPKPKQTTRDICSLFDSNTQSHHQNSVAFCSPAKSD